METKNLPIGLFDSGVGGLTIWKEIHQLLPNESTIYLADSFNAPYGIKSKEEIISLSKKNVDFLIEKGVKLIVVACNTATTNAISELRELYSIPIIGLEPAIKPAVLNSKTKSIGVLATKGTLLSDKFKHAMSLYSDIVFVEQIGYNLVQLIENGKINSEEMHQLLLEYINPMLKQNVDHIVLGCTHYPFLKEHINNLIPDNVVVLDSGLAVANRVEQLLVENNLLIEKEVESHWEFYINTDSHVMSSLLEHKYPIRETNF